MATVAIAAERENYLNQEYGIRSWLLTTDHKRIALLYLISITFFFFIGGAFAGLIRLELLTPQPDLVAERELRIRSIPNPFPTRRYQPLLAEHCP